MKYGIIGCGQMGSVIAEAIIKKEGVGNVAVSGGTSESAKKFAGKYSCSVCDNKAIAEKAKFIILGVKPQITEYVAEEIKEIVKSRKDCILVTMAAGKDISYISKIYSANKVIRIMPNMPAKIGKGIILYAVSASITKEEENEFVSAVEACGYIDKIDEKQIDAASAISGCGPAFAYMFVQSLADGGVLCGLPRDKALMYASKMLEGASLMVSELKEHPDTLKDRVCSPGGTTIEGVKVLEENCFRGTVIDAVKASYEKNKIM